MIYNIINFFKNNKLLSKYILLLSYLMVSAIILAQKYNIAYFLMMLFIVIFTIIDIFNPEYKKKNKIINRL